MVGRVVLLLAGRRHFFRDVEGATGQGATLASASGPPLHLVQLAAAATLTEALATKLQNKRGLGVGTQVLWIKTLVIIKLRYGSTIVLYYTIL